MKEIIELTKDDSDKKLDDLEQLLAKLRSSSIRAVEFIVLWRD